MPYVPEQDRPALQVAAKELARVIAEVAKKYKYDGAFAGEMNFALTRLLEELPRELIAAGTLQEEIRYWIQPLMYGVLLDVALEHKRRVNTSYEAAQIIKSGDCYDTPYYTRLIEVVDENGKLIGHQEVMLKRDDSTLNKSILDAKIVVKLPEPTNESKVIQAIQSLR
jgi:hypothetical protein